MANENDKPKAIQELCRIAKKNGITENDLCNSFRNLLNATPQLAKIFDQLINEVNNGK